MQPLLVRKAYNEYLAGNYAEALKLYQTLGRQLGRDFFAYNIQLCIQKLHQAGIIIPSHNLHVACIMDEFTFSAFEGECDLMPLHADHWQQQMEECTPDMLFIESAWHGYQGSWNQKISTPATELVLLVQWCNEHSVPIVFWCKEDPVHFNTFLAMAKLADIIFTTDVDRIPHYKYQTKNQNVFVLPFAAQPKLHNPIEKYDRKQACCFAGSYYLRYPERQRDFDTLLKATQECVPVEIFDRNFNNPHPHYTFPEEYKPLIMGSLPFTEIDKAYKGYAFNITINTIKQSQTMFARRAFELLASNTVTISNFSRGLRLLLGDLIISSDDKRQITHELAKYCNDVATYRKFRLLGLRKVMSEHTYAHRLQYIISKIWETEDTIAPVPVLMLAVVNTAEQTNTILAAFARQDHPAKILYLVNQTDAQCDIQDERITVFGSISSCAQEAMKKAQQKYYIALLSAEDYYGPMYLTDMTLATRYADASAFGKAAYYKNETSQCKLLHDGAQYTTAPQLFARCSLVAPAQITQIYLKQILATPEDAQITFSNMLALDEFHFCLNGAGLPANVLKNTVGDLAVTNQGIRMHTGLYLRAEQLHSLLPDSEEPEASNTGLPEYSGAELAHALSKPEDKAVRFTCKDTMLHIDSKLKEAAHTYVYMKEILSREECNFIMDSRLRLEYDGDCTISTVCVFLNEKGDKINHTITKAGTTATLPIPPACQSIKFGLRIVGAGKATIKRLVFGSKEESPATIIASAPTLILAKQYPSYDDIYKYGFLHTRVQAYRNNGIKTDVCRFTLSADDKYFSEFEGIDVVSAEPSLLDAALASGSYKHVCVHLLDSKMWDVLKKYVDKVKVTVWVHGAEIDDISKRLYDIEIMAPAEQERQKRLFAHRKKFWLDLLENCPANLHFVFVSQRYAQETFKDLAITPPEGCVSVIHNPINTDLFTYAPKPPEMRCNILSIRPYASRKYANDLTVKAILHLSSKPFFKDLHFRLIGDGIFFDELTSPLQSMPNVTIEKRFLQHAEIAALHKEYGIFLTPTRWDAQGVSRDEAMASGLVPISSNIPVLTEFVDETCGFLVEPENAEALADAIEKLYCNPELFMQMSANAAARVRQQSDVKLTTKKELDLLAKEYS